jgi:nucleoprotein TPR
MADEHTNREERPSEEPVAIGENFVIPQGNIVSEKPVLQRDESNTHVETVLKDNTPAEDEDIEYVSTSNAVLVDPETEQNTETLAGTPDVQVSPIEPTGSSEPNHEQIRSSEGLKVDASSSTLDLSSVSAFLEIDADAVQSIGPVILKRIESKLNEFSHLKSEKFLLEVSLEQATHLSDKKVNIFKSQLTKAQKTNRELTEKNASLESSREDLQQKLLDLEAKYQSSASVSGESRSRIDELIADNRHNLELIEKKNKTIDTLKLEYGELQDASSELRKKLIEVETSAQTANSTLAHQKMKVQSLETQLDLVNKNHEWLNNELEKISNDFSHYRKEKSSEMSTLQAEFDRKSSEFKTLNLRYENLSVRFEDVSKKLDDAFIQVKTLNDEKVVNQEEFIKEMSVKDRLATLLKKSNDDLKSKITHLEERLQSSRTDVADESAVLQTSLEKYKAKLSESEDKIRQLEQTVDELSQAAPSDINASLISIPPLSPSAKAAASKSSGISLSQLYADFTLIKRQLTQERRAKERMQQQMDAFVTELEHKAPIINATKERSTLLENELAELSVILENTSREKDQLQKSQSVLENKFNESQVQITALNKQRIDLARQVQQLLVQVTVRNDTGGQLTPAEHQALERISKGDKVLNESDTDRLISERLVTFQNIVDLQQKNEELLRIIRELGSKLEQEEQTSKSKMEDLESVAIDEAREAILTLQEEVNSVEGKLNAVTRERDMFRSLLSNSGSLNDVLSKDLSSVHSDQISDLTKKYEAAEAQLSQTTEQLNQMKVESETMINMLNKQISALSNERSELSINLAREKSSNALGDERYQTLQQNLKYAKSEIEELRQRSQFLQDNLAKQDLRTQHVAEELVQARSAVESLRSELSNLKAEKQLWKGIEKRLNEENTSLIEEKAKLNTLLMNLQSIDKEREATTAESQKRLLVQSESLERELTVVRNKLAESTSELKDVLTRKEADTQAYQERIDALRSDLGSTREELITRTAAVEQLQHKVESLTSKLASAEGRVRDYQSLTDGSSSESAILSETLKLRQELDDTKAELDTANASVDEFKQIASSSEEALNSMTTSFDGYKESTSTTIEKLQSDNRSLAEKVAILNDQVESLYSELSSKQAQAQMETDLAKREVESLRVQVMDSAKLKDEYDAKVALIESSYQQQVDIATEAQQNYSKELQKHAEASKAFSILREETNAFKQQIAELATEARQAKDQLSKSEESWESQRARLEEELKAATSRVQDLTSQNHILYNEIEKLTKRKKSVSPNDVNMDDSSDELRELINLLRHEKEISETQLNVTSRDLKRVRQQLELVTSELDKTRLELAKFQARDSDLDKLSKDHDQLLQELHQLNLLRESNTTLRNELHANVARVKDLEQKLSESDAKVEPLETNVVQLQAEITHKVQEIKLITEEKDRWKQKSMDIIHKYDRVDPEENGKLKEEIEALTKRNDEITKALEERETTVADLKSKFDRVRREAVEKLKRKDNDIKSANEHAVSIRNQLAEVNEKSQKEIETLKSAIKDFESKAGSLVSPPDNGEEVSELKKELESAKAELSEKMEIAAKVPELKASLNESQLIKTSLEAKISELESELEKSAQQLHSKELSQPSAADTSDLQDQVTKLRADIQELETRKAQLESVKTDAATNETEKSNDNSENIEDALKDQETTLRAKFEEEAKERIEQALQDLKSRIRAPSEAKLQQLVTAKTQHLEQEYNKKVEELKADCDKKLASAGASDVASSDLSKIRSEYEAKISGLKKELEAAKKEALEEGRKLGREATLKETKMRSKLLQNKLDKLANENKELKSKMEKSTASDKPIVGEPSEVGQKRPADNLEEHPLEKKSKNDS